MSTLPLLERHCTHGAPALDDADIAGCWRRCRTGSSTATSWCASLFRDYHETIEFVNALAWMVHREDHHPNCGGLPPLHGFLDHALGRQPAQR
jgi:4a-hydroxytetrahydrobiopterin dehydratase